MRHFAKMLTDRCELGIKLNGWYWQVVASGPLPVILLALLAMGFGASPCSDGDP
jgi:hypothetical protein